MSVTSAGPALNGNPPLPQNGSTTSPVEYVRGLPAEAKEAIFADLVREAIRLNGGAGLIPIDAPDGEQLGYYVPPKAAAEWIDKCIPPLSPEQDAQMRQAMATPDDSAGFDDVVNDWLKTADEPPAR